MKYFVKFRSCLGGATLAPAAETATLPPQELVPLMNAGTGLSSSRASHGRLTRVHSSTQWKPALSAISEEGIVSDAGRDHERKVRSEKKPTVKARSTAKVRSPNHGDDYRKSSLSMAIPAFSPTPFLF
ncbi:hypothetical protein F0562_010979 [Nyssa sinensis]|uniref:Uncharacterized protein n=1 Tax=Nyssa sinensis TaxID=561372 RepID=A0A5J5A398_9ASTE|nr:hypothetical protein F0562_010979 [Nyssa sinensis]